MIHHATNYEKTGVSLLDAGKAMIMLHGRGTAASSILNLSSYFKHSDMAFMAPQATNNTWYPNSFLAPLEENEPDLSSALNVVERMMNQILANGIPEENIYLFGFSQGACLALEYAARNPRHYGGVFGLSGGLIGPIGMSRNYEGSFDGTPVFLGCSDVDSHIPKERVVETAAVFEKMNASVSTRLYPNMPHTIIEDELYIVNRILATSKATV